MHLCSHLPTSNHKAIHYNRLTVDVFNHSLVLIVRFNFVCEHQRHTEGNHHLYSVNDDSKFLTNFTCLEKQPLEWIFCTQLVTSTLDRQRRSLGKKPFILVCHLWLSGFAIRVTFGSHRSLQLKVSHYTPPSEYQEFCLGYSLFTKLCYKFPGAFQLLQLQEDIRRQFKVDGSGPENDVETHIRLNKETLMNSLWKLNVVDIEVTLLHVCQMVSSWFFCWVMVKGLYYLRF